MVTRRQTAIRVYSPLRHKTNRLLALAHQAQEAIHIWSEMRSRGLVVFSRTRPNAE